MDHVASGLNVVMGYDLFLLFRQSLGWYFLSLEELYLADPEKTTASKWRRVCESLFSILLYSEEHLPCEMLELDFSPQGAWFAMSSDMANLILYRFFWEKEPSDFKLALKEVRQSV